MRDHRKLRAFELADLLALTIYRETEGFPKSEEFGLKSQLRRGAVSVASDIVEGCARRTKTDSIRFLDIAYGSARELEYQVSLASRLGFFDKQQSQNIDIQCEETSKVLYGLIQGLRRS